MRQATEVAVAARLREGMARGVLAFPLTSFRADGGLDLDDLADLEALLAYGLDLVGATA
ncbi:hypothetical protein [Streptomyces sp. NPDC005408]|uniref:hypothetical protein n=1 Tax=Streptomyces sp. NPDC005408 TaxID=3155341 RepID=UPI0033B60706